jgi:hypothetical protein
MFMEWLLKSFCVSNHGVSDFILEKMITIYFEK